MSVLSRVLVAATVAATAALVVLNAPSADAKFFHHNEAKKYFAPIPPAVAAKLDTTTDVSASELPALSLEEALRASPAERQAMQEAAKVRLPGLVSHGGDGSGDIFSYSGYVLADSVNNGNLFYWFFEAINGDKNAPVMVWLQGGPGGSSMFGLLAENGPYYLTDDLQLIPRNITWNQNYAMLYIDNPVGVGFSFVDTDQGYSRDEDSVANNLFNGLSAFFAVYTQYQQNPFYIAGESYAGKYVPAAAYRIYQANNAHLFPGVAPAAVPINLVGISIGDGWTDPRQQIQGYAELAFNFGLVSTEEFRVMRRMSDEAVRYIDQQNWPAAAQMFENLVDGPPDYFQNVTGISNYYNILETVEPSYGGNEDAYLNQSTIRAALHVGSHYYDVNSGYAGFLLTDDLCKSMAPILPTVYENYKVLTYSGALDFIVGAALTEEFLPTIRWSGAEGFRTAQKVIWRVNPSDVEVAGYARQYNNFTYVVVRGAGHILPFDQPARGFDMITRFVDDIPFTD